MKRILRFMTSMLAIICLVPNVTLGRPGDIYDLVRSIKYDLSSSKDKETLKSDLKSKTVSEDDLYIEDDSGGLVKYNSMKHAERQAILNILLSHGVDISNPEEFKNGIIQYNDEIQNAQKEAVDSLPTEEIPTIVDVPGEENSIKSATYTLQEFEEGILLTITSVRLKDNTEYSGNLYMSIYENDALCVNKELIKVNEVQNLPLSDNIIVELYLDNITDSKYTIDTSKRIKPENITLNVGVSGNMREGYKVAWSYNIKDIKGNELLNDGSYKIGLKDLDTGTTEVIFSAETSEGETTVPEVYSLNLVATLLDKDNITLKTSPLLVANYEVLDRLYLLPLLPTSKSEDRMSLTILSQPTYYPYRAYYLEIIKDDTTLVGQYVGVEETFEMQLNEGDYKVLAYTSENKDVLLYSTTIDFVWGPPNDLTILPYRDVSGTDIPWNYEKPWSVRIKPIHNNGVLINELFKLRVLDNKTKTTLLEGNITSLEDGTDTEVQLPVSFGSQYVFQILDTNNNVQLEKIYYADVNTQLVPGTLTSINLLEDNHYLSLYFNDWEDRPINQYMELVDNIIIHCLNEAHNEIFSFEVHPLLTGGYNVFNIPMEYVEIAENIKYVVYTFYTKDGYNSSITTDAGLVQATSQGDTVIVLPDITPEIIDDIEIPSGIDIQFEDVESTDINFHSQDAGNEKKTQNNSAHERISILPNVNKSEEDDMFAPDNIQPDDDFDFELPTITMLNE